MSLHQGTVAARPLSRSLAALPRHQLPASYRLRLPATHATEPCGGFHVTAPPPLAAQGRTDTASAGYSASGNAEFVLLAAAGAPATISDSAAIARLDRDGSLTIVWPGINGSTCMLLPDGTATPVCADSAATQCTMDAFSKRPRPTNTRPGIAYMAQGSTHFETTDGQIVMAPSATTKAVKEPPHWMIWWAADSTSGLPTHPNAGGSYIMFAGTPFAHLMIYQDPKMFTRK